MIWLFFNLTRYFDSTFCVIKHARECLPLLGFQSLYADLLRLLWYLTHQLINDRSFWKLIICCFPVVQMFLQGLSKDVFERRRSTRNELFFLSIWHDATKFVFPSIFSLIETICLKIRSKSRPKIAKCLLPSSTFDEDIGRQEYPL